MASIGELPKITQILMCLEEPKRFSEIKSLVGISDQGLTKNLNSLREAGLVTEKDGRYALTEKGSGFLNEEVAKLEAAAGTPQGRDLYEPTRIFLVLAYDDLRSTGAKAGAVGGILGAITFGGYFPWVVARERGKAPNENERKYAAWLRRLYVDSVIRNSPILEDLSDELKLKSMWTLAKEFSDKDLPFDYDDAYGKNKKYLPGEKVIDKVLENRIREIRNLGITVSDKGQLTPSEREKFLKIWGWLSLKWVALGRHDFQIASKRLVEIARRGAGLA